jgi:hypothetical protein
MVGDPAFDGRGRPSGRPEGGSKDPPLPFSPEGLRNSNSERTYLVTQYSKPGVWVP